MKRFVILALAASAGAQEPAPRRLTAVPLRADARFATVSGARELRDGRVLVTDAKQAAVYLIDPKTGASQLVGSAGGDSLQYAQPGGLYPGLADTTLLLDRGLKRVLFISPAGRIVASKSIARRGVSSSSDLDVDLQRIDTRLFTYFVDRAGGLRAMASGTRADSSLLIRFDPVRQRGDTVAKLRLRESRQTQVDEHSTIGQDVIGSPQDEWGIAPEGRLVVVRASPYRVEWHAPSGQVTVGPAIAFEPIPFSAAERDAIAAKSRANAPSAGLSGSAPTSAANRQIPFAPTKPPFDLYAVIVAPDGRVWVERTAPLTATTTTYDVFDARGARIDRVELPGKARVIGFGPSSIYVNVRDEAGRASLAKYQTP